MCVLCVCLGVVYGFVSWCMIGLLCCYYVFTFNVCIMSLRIGFVLVPYWFVFLICLCMSFLLGYCWLYCWFSIGLYVGYWCVYWLLFGCVWF